MAIVTKIDSIERDIDLIFADMLSPEAQSAQLADYARTALADAEAVNEHALGFAPPFRTFVDGREGATLETVRPGGVIVFEFELLNDIFAWIGEQLLQASPVLSGRYAASHAFLADGVVVEPGAPVPPATEYVFVNTVPYARKIERGESGQAPDGVYQAVAAVAARRFNNIASIKFSFRAPLFGAINDWAGATSFGSKMRSAKTRAEWLRRQPAIVITVY